MNSPEQRYRKTLTLGHSPDADDAFMFWAMAKGKIDMRGYRFRHVMKDIQTLNLWAEKGKLDVTAMSVHAYGHNTSRYQLLPYGISMGDNYGPILVTRRLAKFEDLKGKRIAVPGARTTAYLTLCLLLKEFKAVQMPFDAIMDAVKKGKVDAGLIIHEGQLTYRREGLHLAGDLGKLWLRKTGLPLPLGVNTVKRSLPGRVKRDISDILKQSIASAMKHRREAVQYSLMFGRGMDHRLADRFVGMYVNRWSERLGERGRRSIRVLLERAWKAGMLDKKPKIVFV